MLTEDEKKYYEKRIKEYKFLRKTFLYSIFIPVGIFIYCIKTIEEGDLSLIIFGIVIFVVAYVGLISFQTKADILNDILNKTEFKKQSKSETNT